MSMQIKPEIKIDTAGIAMKIRKAAEKALPTVTDQILKDTKQYVPRREGNLGGTLERSASTPYYLSPTKAELRWSTVYANYVYKGVSKHGRPLRYNKHPNKYAGAEWCKRAKELHLSDWNSTLNQEMRKYFKNG